MKKSVKSIDDMERLRRMEHDMAHLAWRMERMERMEQDMQRMAYYDVMERVIASKRVSKRRKQASK